MSGRDAHLLVVGAGPGGLATALAAHALGVEVAVLERDPDDRTRPGSRALFLHRDSMRVLDRACPGLGGRLADRGVTWRRRTTTYRGRTVHSREITPHWSLLPPFTSLRQVDTEDLLRDAVRAAGIPLVTGAEVAGVRTGADGVVAELTDGSTRRACYLVAADGARSTIRAYLGIGLRGDRSDSHHVVVDVAGPSGGERVFHYRHPGVGGRHVLVVPFAGGCQVDLQCRADDDPDELAGEAAVARWLPPVLDADAPRRVLWRARYPFLQRIAESMSDRSGRVLLVGEAGHLFPPFGARGMNSAIADGDAAATAVALALRAGPHRADAAVADYARWRGEAAERNGAAAGAALRHMRPATVRARVVQAGAAALAPVVPSLGAWLDRAPYGPRLAPSGGSGGPAGRY